MDFLIIPVLAAAESGSGPVSELAGRFHIEWPILIAQAINFLIVAYVLWRFAIRPVTRTLDERNKKIADGLQYAEEMKQQLAEAERKHAETLRQAQQEAQQLIEEARTQAREFEEKQRQEATARAEAIIQKAYDANQAERKKMLEEVRGEVSRLVVQTASRVLGKDLSEEERGRFNQSATREISSLN